MEKFKSSPQIVFKPTRLQFSQLLKCPNCGRALQVFVDVRDGEKRFDIDAHGDPLCKSVFELRADDAFDADVWKQLDVIWSVKKE